MPEGFEALDAWRKAHELMLFIHRSIVPYLPRDERWDLARQIRSSSKSIGANIAEGYGRFYYQDNVRFCYNGRGSLLETVNHLNDARDLEYISLDLYRQARQLSDDAYRLLNGYIAWLKKCKQGADEPGVNIIPDVRPSESEPPCDPPANSPDA